MAVKTAGPGMPAGFAPRLTSAELASVKARHSLSTVLARLGVVVPDGWAADPHRLELRTECPCPACASPSHGSTPPFIIRADNATWYCHREQTGGDVLQLVRNAAGISSLRRAADLLASDEPIGPPGVDPPAGPPRRVAAQPRSQAPDPGRTPIGRVQAVNAQAWRFYTLPKLAQAARRYLLARKIDVTVLEAETGQPAAGFTPQSRTGLVDHLRRKGFSGDEIVDAGWGSRPSGGGDVRDFYHDRVLLPFRDALGRVTGATGRAVAWKPGDLSPKYLNHRDTAVFAKRTALYRPVAQQHLGRHATVLAVEGTLDALAIACAAARQGSTNLFAPCTQSGLSLTDDVAPRFFALHPAPPILCADGDQAGQSATARWATAAMDRYHREVCTLVLPDGRDPAEWLAEHGDDALVTFARKGCLTDPAHVRATPAGALIARAEWQQQAGNHPGLQPWEVAAAVTARLAGHAANLADPPARARFAASAGAGLIALVDGQSAEQHAARILAEADRLDATATPCPLGRGQEPAGAVILR